MGIPSTTYNGWLLPEIEVMLLSVTVVEEPGAPPLDDTFMPDTRPCNAEMKLSRPDSMMSAAFTFCTDEPTDRATRFIPNSAVISTSPNTLASSSSVIVSGPLPISTVFVLYPM